MGGRGKSGKGKQASRLDVVKEWEHLGKKLLKPYPDGEGLCIKTGGVAVGKFFAPESLQSALTADNCELLARPVMGVNLLAAAAESALPALQAASDEPGKGGLADAKRCLEKLAAHLPAMQANSGAEEKAVETAIGKLVALGEDAGPLMKTFAKLADTSSRLYVLSTWMLQWLALAAKPKAWGKAVQQPDLQPACLRPWTKHPGDVDALVQSLAAGLTGAVHWGGARKTKRKLGDSGSDSPPAAADASSSTGTGNSGSENSSEDSKAKKKQSKKDKKGKKRTKKAKKDKKSKGKKPEGKKKHKKSTSSEKEDAAKAKEPAARTKAHHPAVTMASTDEESEEAKTPDFGSWPADDFALFRSMLEGVEKNQSATLAELVGIMDHIPSELRGYFGLEPAAQKLKEMTRAPKAAKLEQLTKAWRVLLDAAPQAAGGPSTAEKPDPGLSSPTAKPEQME